MRSNQVVFWQAGWLFALVVVALLLSACQPAATSTQAVPVTGETAAPTLAEPATAPTQAATEAATKAATEAAAESVTEAAEPTSAPTQAQSNGAGSGDDDYGYERGGAGAGGGAGAVTDEVKLTILQDPALGRYLADEQGMTLYLFTKDSPGMSACEGDCLAKWPPLLVAQGGEVEIDGMDEEGIVGTITRSDGSLQVTYRGMPLYYWVNDTRPGETTGQGVGGVWFVVEP